jgi:hypothetical protein
MMPGFSLRTLRLFFALFAFKSFEIFWPDYFKRLKSVKSTFVYSSAPKTSSKVDVISTV